jgi:amino acid transporter
MVIIAVVSLQWVPRAARAGWSSVTLWSLAAALFFLPLAAVVLELSTRFPDQGGLYVWTGRAFGPRHAFFCGWCLWLNQVFYFPSYLLYALANVLTVSGEHGERLGTNRFFSVAIVLLLLWALTALNVLGFQVAKWVQGIGTLGIWVPVGLLVAAAVFVLAKGRAGNPVHAVADLLPQGNFFAAFALWSSMCFAFSGFEIAAMVGEEIKNVAKTLPLGLAIAGASILVLYLGGSGAILLVTPASEVNERTGIGNAIASATGSAGMGGLVALLIAVATVATTSSWMAGAARVPYAAAVEGWLPAIFSRLHAKYKTPHIALIAQAVFASLTLLVSMFLNIEDKSTTVEEAYDVLVNLTILIYFVPYLYLFTSPLFLPPEAQEEGLRIPGGLIGRRAICAVGVMTTLASIVLLFVPPPGTKGVVNFEANLVLQSGAIFGAGLLLMLIRGRKAMARAEMA